MRCTSFARSVRRPHSTLPLRTHASELILSLVCARDVGKRITALSQTAKGAAYRDTMTRLSMLLEEIPSVRVSRPLEASLPVLVFGWWSSPMCVC